MRLATEPRDLPFRIPAGGVLDGLQALLAAHCALDQGADFPPAQGLASGGPGGRGTTDFFDDASGEHCLRPAMDAGVQLRAVALQNDALRGGRGLFPFFAEARKWTAGE